MEKKSKLSKEIACILQMMEADYLNEQSTVSPFLDNIIELTLVLDKHRHTLIITTTRPGIFIGKAGRNILCVENLLNKYLEKKLEELDLIAPIVIDLKEAKSPIKAFIEKYEVSKFSPTEEYVLNL